MAEARSSAQKAVEIVWELAQADPAYNYDLACAVNLRRGVTSSDADAEEAVAVLRHTIQEGFDNGHLLSTDPRLDGIRSRPEFPVLGTTEGNAPVSRPSSRPLRGGEKATMGTSAERRTHDDRKKRSPSP
jgi:hypothetical protein